MLRRLTIAGAPGSRTLRRAWPSWLAMVCLAAMWVHVWHHHAEHEDDGHYGTELNEQCFLADVPPATPSATALCDFRPHLSVRTASSGIDFAEPAQTDVHPIRAPPHAV